MKPVEYLDRQLAAVRGYSGSVSCTRRAPNDKHALFTAATDVVKYSVAFWNDSRLTLRRPMTTERFLCVCAREPPVPSTWFALILAACL